MTVQEFAERIEKQSKIQLMKHKMDCAANWHNSETRIHYGRKWTRIDIGPSGRYMIDPQGHIFGIKAYGVPNLRHYYGTLDNPTNLGDHWGLYTS